MLVFTLVFPIVIAGILHMWVVKKNYLSFLKNPISIKSFGENKTYRGLFIMPLGTFLGSLLIYPQFFSRLENPFICSFMTGIFYILFELPNSFLKRRLGIKPGLLPKNNRFLFSFIDQIDSLIGIFIVYFFIGNIKGEILISTLFLGVLVHYGVNYFLYKINLRKNPI